MDVDYSTKDLELNSLRLRAESKLNEIQKTKQQTILHFKQLELWEDKLKSVLQNENDKKESKLLKEPLVTVVSDPNSTLNISAKQLFDLLWIGFIRFKLKSKITRVQKSLPVIVRIKFAPELHELIFGTDPFEVVDDLLLELIFEDLYKKTFQRGSYAQIVSPMKVYYKKKKTCIEVNYKVYNKYGVLQWPI